ncbi:hypothetical protein LEP1GSC047_3539 [Leptospira inadai serovar Lyme str. 10]|uniref:Uncharacterized protein n=1 Tax=Leptospira inadai serovar Lyme str. 10 TaxID=1049790 RepID=V6HDZ1_9LEPT|nr:hypothetical protein LEP1GSC047_3539 [Leptospira inadai serovar Lyme str. 10]
MIYNPLTFHLYFCDFRSVPVDSDSLPKSIRKRICRHLYPKSR